MLRAEPWNPRHVHAPGGRERALGGVPDPEEAAPVAIAAYLGAYGPATIEAFGNWLAGGWFGKRQLRAWFDALGDGWPRSRSTASARTCWPRTSTSSHRRSRPPAVRLLPGFDQYVLGPGTEDGSRRAAGVGEPP